jgi:hypothetical protein
MIMAYTRDEYCDMILTLSTCNSRVCIAAREYALRCPGGHHPDGNVFPRLRETGSVISTAHVHAGRPRTVRTPAILFLFRNFPWIHSFPQPKDIKKGFPFVFCIFRSFSIHMFLWWVGSWPTAPTPNLGDQDFLSGLSPLAFGVPTPLLQGNKICNPRQGSLQFAIIRSQPNPVESRGEAKEILH